MNEILVPCEGSGCRTHGTNFGWLCAMCGEIVPIDDDGRALPHDRIDVLTMLERRPSPTPRQDRRVDHAGTRGIRMTTEHRHVTFNPAADYLGHSALREILRANEPEGWALLRVVQNHQYEFVAVLERPQPSDGSQEASE